MAAAPNLPLPEVFTHTINISSTPPVASPQGIIVGQGDTVNFQNNCGSDVTIVFLSNGTGPAVYPPMSLLVPNGGNPVGFTAPMTPAAANYNIMINGVPQNDFPYVIQVGSGPMYVLATDPGGVTTFTPTAVAVPLGNITSGMGYLQIQSNIPNAPPVPINWASNNNPFNPGITQSGPAQPVKTGTTPGNYDYSTPTSVPDARAGGGTVIIRST